MLIDLTHAVRHDRHDLPVYPGDRETVLIQSSEIGRDGYNNHLLTANMHAGTHIDGPMHLLDVHDYLSRQPLESFIGEGCLIEAEGHEKVEYRAEYEELLKPGGIVLIRTGHDRLFGKPDYFQDYPVLSEAFAELLVRNRVKMVGLDTPSPDRYPFEVHKLLFRSGILIAENLTGLEKLSGHGAFEVIALPLKIEADSALARIVARTLEK